MKKMEREGKPKIATSKDEVERDHGGDEEKKIEEFFAIVKRLREARSLIMKASNKDAKKVKVHGPVWTPVFKLEDFAGQEKDGNSNISVRCSFEKDIGKGNEKEGEEKGLDLNLTL